MQDTREAKLDFAAEPRQGGPAGLLTDTLVPKTPQSAKINTSHHRERSQHRLQAGLQPDGFCSRRVTALAARRVPGVADPGQPPSPGDPPLSSP